MNMCWQKKFLVCLSAIFLCTAGAYCRWIVSDATEDTQVSTTQVVEDSVLIGGMPVGIYLETDGVLVLDTESIQGMDGLEHEPAKHLVKSGDYIIGWNDTQIARKSDLLDAVAAIESDEKITLTIRRSGEIVEAKLSPILSAAGEYKLGIWVRDNVQGLGTITFLTSNNEFGALGHGIHDTDTSVLLEISDGAIYKTSIHSIRKGQNGIPGSMEGIIVYNSYNKLGKIDYNCDLGIYGTVENVEELFTTQEAVPVAAKEEIEIGPATIRCFVDNNVEEYDIMVTNIDESRRDANKGLVIEVTDSDLLEKTGGIIQGMSGSPILQNGKMIGAVTHVFVQDSTKGYGIFIENMLKNVASNRLSNE